MKYRWKHLRAGKYNHVSTDASLPTPKRVTSFWEVVSLLLLGCGVGEADVCTSKGSPSVVWSWLRCEDHRFTLETNIETNIHFWTNLLWLSLLGRIDFSNGREKVVSYELSYTCHEETLFFFTLDLYPPPTLFLGEGASYFLPHHP